MWLRWRPLSTSKTQRSNDVIILMLASKRFRGMNESIETWFRAAAGGAEEADYDNLFLYGRLLAPVGHCGIAMLQLPRLLYSTAVVSFDVTDVMTAGSDGAIELYRRTPARTGTNKQSTRIYQLASICRCVALFIRTHDDAVAFQPAWR